MNKNILNIDGDFEISYIETRTNNNTVILFLHGWGMSKESFQKIFKYIPEEFGIIALDFPGFGESSDLESSMTNFDYAKVMENFLKSCCSGKQIIYLAHSFGGRVALESLRSPFIRKRVQKTVFVDVPFFALSRYSFIRVFARTVNSLLGNKIILKYVPFINRLLRKILMKIFGVDKYVENGNKKIMSKTFRNVLLSDADTKGYVIEKDIIIWGDNDVITPIWQGELVSNKYNVELIKIKDGKHFPFLVKDKEFSTVLNKILYEM